MIRTLRPRCWPINGLLVPSDYAYNSNFVSGPCVEEEMDWARIRAYITGTVDQELLSRNEYLVTENRILKRQLKGRLLLSDAERERRSEKLVIGSGARRSRTWRTPPSRTQS